ncbi:flavin reductase family protein [Ponticoccus sp. SC2-23]|uniref:flavin reductase family protein n=1 Tax=Alexandriicola marinus TaxID=2081710 RepID=UPI000FD9FE3A|nr:flavin reductase family protein [Alexandriicola marinus]MBM1220823.1 flavin reductase family protein [Ponticoccus sp. SC6-9]MBM1225393.1 flavin reductase family protein [Ponticoccus sp. SC6-15]MBM1227576.1 flavin reductase family protein [Ponticoccus sp. SC6-38]MBM1234786.1 flavin reductase family protein [Ponticoccus sp. SC6-45]MBM1238078.1 flavin reductase family protein [Ponticoccus sp. SC6-49]MBM1244289.1 flavin reductase family protein [Ponticoccus sp. SC2-64]MBM1248310.1 flavin redu
MDATAAGAETVFSPDTDSLAFRRALGSFATGVTIVTAPGPDGPVGITANSFASVSLDPPLVLWSPAKASRRFDYFATAPHFAIHVLGAGDHAICEGFSRAHSAFDALDWSENAHGVPLIHGVAARFECTLEASHDAGDHLIIVGRVTRVAHDPQAPLVFHAGQFGGFAPRG